MDRPWQQKAFSRPLTDRERFAFLGHDPGLTALFPNVTTSRIASGNVIGLPQLSSVLMPMISQSVQLNVMRRFQRQRNLSEAELMRLVDMPLTLPIPAKRKCEPAKRIRKLRVRRTI